MDYFHFLTSPLGTTYIETNEHDQIVRYNPPVEGDAEQEAALNTILSAVGFRSVFKEFSMETVTNAIVSREGEHKGLMKVCPLPLQFSGAEILYPEVLFSNQLSEQ